MYKKYHHYFIKKACETDTSLAGYIVPDGPGAKIFKEQNLYIATQVYSVERELKHLGNCIIFQTCLDFFELH